MKDLDMSDVIADGERMYQELIDMMYVEFNRDSDEELAHKRYKVGSLAREGNFYAIDATLVINHLLLTRTVTTLCEGCLDRTGCDMCCPPDFTEYDYPEYDEQTAHFERFGRPAFPNEY